KKCLDHDFHIETVFKSNEQEVYRIPALFYDRDKILMAFAEKWRTSDGSSGLALVLKSGKMNKDETTHEVTIEWSEPISELVKVHLDGYRPMNLCPVYEKTSKTLFLFFICVEGTVSEQQQIDSGCNKARLCYVTTNNAGQSWSDVTDLTESLAEINNWATFAVGPGHGLQTESGRLIVPVYAYASGSRLCCSSIRRPIPYALSLYSDDKGNTWQVFDDTDNNSLIYCNARNIGGYREEAVSKNNGDDFTKLRGNLVETGGGCQGSVVSFPSKRVHLRMYLNTSPGSPNAWSKPCVIYRGPSGYSDLAYIDDGWFACLMECGKHCETEQIAVKVFGHNEVKQVIGE
uniref:exo-alpha-sialidase n=1 Tax=Sander lucioperca TaxID=283035 RepID=A0A8D0AIS9_SANLU